MTDLQRQLRQRLPGYSVSVTPRNGELHVHIGYKGRNYTLTISNPDGKISVENIAANAVKACSQ